MEAVTERDSPPASMSAFGDPGFGPVELDTTIALRPTSRKSTYEKNRWTVASILPATTNELLKRGFVQPFVVITCEILVLFLFPVATGADVVVLANRTERDISMTAVAADRSSQQRHVGPGEVLVLPVAGESVVSYDDDLGRLDYRLEGDSLYYFTVQDGRLVLQRVEFEQVVAEDPQAGQTASGAAATPPLPMGGATSFFRMGVIPVMVLVDDEEPAIEALWEQRLRDRVERASDIIEPYSGIRFRVVAVGTWDSSDEIKDWTKATREFEIEVSPLPAALAIGFTSQFQMPEGNRMHLGTIGGPLHPHILIREGPPKVSEPERLEVLVHELGHYLGAVHCPQPDSVMRPLLGDGQARSKAFPIRFDGVNTLIVNLVGSEIRNRGILLLRQVSPKRKQQLHSIFKTVADEIPGDEVAQYHLKMLDVTPIRLPPLVVDPDSLVASTRIVVEAVVAAAEANQNSSGQQAVGDELATLFVQSAAGAAQSLPAGHRSSAFLVGLAIALDDSTFLRNNLLLGPMWRQVESDAQRAERLKVLGSPTMKGRRDLAQHFVVSSGLTALAGAGTAEAMGVSKELLDARGGSGFSFADLSADLAGIAFAEHIVAHSANLQSISGQFSVERFLPNHDGLPEGLSWQEFFKSYGSTQDARFRRQRSEILRRIQGLPAYTAAP